ncbi:DUF2339 domain-containing protein [Alkanindiges illinoisensis]|uniref:DUF2339 domain-containing protein n=1 Tax=Alkanindiges illinoisensis TaxID=197183 RepID=UPI00047D7AE2|nr:DUF2339 domain-containing protein [Alkanindiges illinoisensis]
MFHLSFWAIVVFLLPLALAIVALVTSLRTQRQLEQDVSRLEQLLKTTIQQSQAYQQASGQTTATSAQVAAQADSSQQVLAHQSSITDDIPVTAHSLESQVPLEPAATAQASSIDEDLIDSAPTGQIANPAKAAWPQATTSPTRPQLLEPDEQSLSVVTSIWHSFLQWFKGGNAIVRIGVIVLLVGVILLLRLANDLLTIPIEVRLGAVAIGGVALTLIGLKLRQNRRSYAISIQGAGLAIVYFTLFAAFRLYEVLPASLTFGLLAILAIVSAALALMQNALPLALLAFGGGFLAPLLTSTGSNNLVGLFSYYLILNLALAWMAHYKTWKVLNVLGAGMTFGMAGYLGWNSYEDSMRWPLEGLLLAHLALYLFIVVRYSQQLATVPADESVRVAPVDSSLLFGVPLMGFALQAGLLHDIPYALALSSAVLSELYLALGYKLFYQNRKLVLLTEGVLALGIGFMALVIPLALDAQWTAVGWSVQGAALVWLGKRQNRIWSIRFGVLLEVLSTLALLWLSFDGKELLLPLVVYSVCLFICALLVRKQNHQGVNLLLNLFQPAFLILAWAFAASQVMLRELEQWSMGHQVYWPLHHLQFSLYPLIFIFITMLASWRFYWPQLSLLIRLILAALTLHAAVIWLDYGHLLVHRPLLLLTIFSYAAFGLLAIQRLSRQLIYANTLQEAASSTQQHSLSSRVEQAIWAMGLLIYSSVLLQVYWIKQPMIAMIILPLGLISALLLVKKPLLLIQRHTLLHDLSVPVSVALFGWMMAANWLSSGQIGGLPYIPVLNVLDICLIGAGLVIYRLMMDLPPVLIKVAQAGLGIAAFFSLTSLIIRTLHQWAGTPLWENGAWQVDLVQTSLTIIWTLCALILTGLASRYGWRQVWLAGIALLAVVVIKLLLVDLSNVAAIARIVSFIGAGLIMLLIGYIAPLPPVKIAEIPPSSPESRE